MISHRIEVLNITFAQLAASEAKRIELKQALDAHGQNGWEAVHFQEAGPVLLIFMVKRS